MRRPDPLSCAPAAAEAAAAEPASASSLMQVGYLTRWLRVLMPYCGSLLLAGKHKAHGVGPPQIVGIRIAQRLLLPCLVQRTRM